MHRKQCLLLKNTKLRMNSSAARCPSLREDGLSLARERPEVRAHSSPSLPLWRQEVKEGMSLSSDGLEVTSVPRHKNHQDSPADARSIKETSFSLHAPVASSIFQAFGGKRYVEN